jgi:hypothetical protein
VNDSELREAFHAMADEDARFAPPYSRADVSARRGMVRASRKRALYAAGVCAVAAAAVLAYAFAPRQEMLELDLSGTRLTSATDFLLDTPGSDLLRTVPSIGIVGTAAQPDAVTSRIDTSRRDQ